MVDIENDLMVSASRDLCAQWYNNHTSTSHGFETKAVQYYFALTPFVQEKKTTIIVVGDGPISKTAMCLCRLGLAHVVSVDPECITSPNKVPEGCEEWLTLPNLTISPSRVETMQFPIPTRDFVILSLCAHVELQKYLHKFPTTPNVVITVECGCVPQTLTSEECTEYHLQSLPIHGNKWNYLKRWVKKERK